MIHNFLIFSFYYLLILVSVLGYGLFFLKLLNININNNNFGYVGLFGVYVLIIYSYISNIVIAHSELHNLLILFLGITAFILIITKNFLIYKKESILTFIVFILLFCSLFQFKNHDDFTYYHFPYTYYLTQQSLYIGVGQFNHGFRTPSSIFYINSLFYLPFAKFYLLNFFSVLILGFANIVLLKKIHSYFISFTFKKEKINFTNFLSLLSFTFLNIFFYRISEYGTDRAAMILVILLIIELLNFTYITKIKKIDLFYVYMLGAIIISLKAFYILYLVFIIPLFIHILKQNQNYLETIKILFLNKYFILFLTLLFFVLFTYFINTGCIIYPLYFTCFESISWGIPLLEVNQMNNWYELWSKGGAAPNFRIENPEEYIKNFNWVNNWINNYFLNKVSDFIFGLILLVGIVSLFFREAFFSKKKIEINQNTYLVYIIILILGFEWFYNHPALRYGGYHIIALLLFIPIATKLGASNVILKKYTKNTFILISITIFVFVGRNLNRINKEIEFYNYEPLKTTFYSIDNNNFRIQEQMDQLINEYHECQNKTGECTTSNKVKKIYGKIIFKN
tara:strand:+ start:2408 stop:4108 length:1701 start_codon:yes stop_codon:yes gene_type:complete